MPGFVLLVSAIGVAAWLLGGTMQSAGGPPVAAPTAQEGPSDHSGHTSTAPTGAPASPAEVPSAPVGSPEADRGPAASRGPAPADAADDEQTEPAGSSLQDAASQSQSGGGRRELGAPREPVAPEEILDEGRGLGGCLKEYGDNGQCLPVIPPSESGHIDDMRANGEDPAEMEHPWQCSEVRQYLPDGVSVRVSGVDPQGLDRNNDGIACGPGD